MNREVRGIDDDIGAIPNLRHRLAFALNAHLQGIFALQGVGAPHRVEAANEHIIAGIEEEHGGLHAQRR